jgi:hypothetical protein
MRVAGKLIPTSALLPQGRNSVLLLKARDLGRSRPREQGSREKEV